MNYWCNIFARKSCLIIPFPFIVMWVHNTHPLLSTWFPIHLLDNTAGWIIKWYVRNKICYLDCFPYSSLTKANLYLYFQHDRDLTYYPDKSLALFIPTTLFMIFVFMPFIYAFVNFKSSPSSECIDTLWDESSNRIKKYDLYSKDDDDDDDENVHNTTNCRNNGWVFYCMIKQWYWLIWFYWLVTLTNKTCVYHLLDFFI